MPIFNASSLGLVGSITTNICLYPQNIINNSLPINNCSSSCTFYNPNSSTNSFLRGFPNLTVKRYPIQGTQISASSSNANVDEVLDSPQRPVRRPADWEAAKRYKETGALYEGRVEGFNSGGLLISFYSLVGFLPFPQLSPSHSCKEPTKAIQEIARGLVGSVMPMKVIEADEENKMLVFSEKEAAWSNYSEKINVGDVLDARVGMVEDYGAFVHLRFPDGTYHLTGLVHVSEVSWDFVQDVRDVLSEGDNVRVKVIHIDREKSRITLSIKQLEEDPLLETLDKVIPKDGDGGPYSTSPSMGDDIQPLPGLEEIMQELLKEDGISEVRIRRQGFEKRVVSQDLQFWLSNAPTINNQSTILARAGRQVQEIQLTTSLDQDGIKKALQRVLERVP